MKKLVNTINTAIQKNQQRKRLSPNKVSFFLQISSAFLKGENKMNFDLDYRGFEEFMKTRTNDVELKGVSFRFRFENNYGASVVKHKYSYGHEEDLWELAVIEFTDEPNEEWHITYETPITEDVVGCLKDEAVRELLGKIKNLPV